MGSDELARRLAAAEAEIEQLRALVIRSYEETPRLAAAVLRARRSPSYRAAYGDEPLVTARIGTYRGGEELFERALASVLRQTYRRWQAVVVCDGPEEEVATRIAALGEPRIRCVQRPRNGPYPDRPRERWLVGGVHPFNQAVALAEGDWIAPIDHDDEWEDDHLEVLLDAARSSGAELVYGVSRVILGEGEETYFGAWPPRLTDFGFQAAIYHGGLAELLYDANSHLVGEPADWNLARRMLEAGVAFEFVERIVARYYVDAENPNHPWWQERRRERGAFGAGGGAK